jgi:hypothetical protein
MVFIEKRNVESFSNRRRKWRNPRIIKCDQMLDLWFISASYPKADPRRRKHQQCSKRNKTTQRQNNNYFPPTKRLLPLFIRTRKPINSISKRCKKQSRFLCLWQSTLSSTSPRPPRIITCLISRTNQPSFNLRPFPSPQEYLSISCQFQWPFLFQITYPTQNNKHSNVSLLCHQTIHIYQPSSRKPSSSLRTSFSHPISHQTSIAILYQTS